ncbi:PucR family transcriptional regulator [Lentzea sp. NPDC004789]
MANPATRWEEQVDARTLRVAGEQERRIAEFRAKVREAGERWAGARPAGLAELLREAAADDPELARLARASGQLLEDFMEGLSRTVAAPSGDLAADLIDGRHVPSDVLERLSPTYVVTAARSAADRPAEVGRDFEGHGVMFTRKAGGLVLLVPGGDSALLDRITARLADGASWVATARGKVTELAGAYAEVSDVLHLVVAGCRPFGVYGMTDVLVEHAITRNDSVAARLAEVVRPLRENQALWETLVALVRTDFNRNQAARDLFIHRSTMDYRLQRITKMTGCDPVSSRGSQLLSAALIADAVA